MNINQKLYSESFVGISPKYVRLGVVLFVGLGFCVLSLLAGVVLGLFDKRAEIITKRKTGDGVCVCVCVEGGDNIFCSTRAGWDKIS